MKRTIRRLLFRLRARRHADELAEELEQHRAVIQARLEADGIPASEAARLSRRAMGNATLAREDARDVWIFRILDRVWRDATYGARGLRREPLFALTACGTLALGLAIATTVFSIVDAELWKPLPFPDPDQLVSVYPRAPGPQGSTEGISGAELTDWRGRSQSFSGLAAADRMVRSVLRRDSAEWIWTTPVTTDYFAVLREPALIGRLLSTTDDRSTPAAVLSERAWRRLFEGDPGMLGRTVTIDDRPVVIVGVRSASRQFAADPTDVYLAIDERSAEFRDRSRRTLDVTGRLRPGVSAAAAQAEMSAIADHIAEQYPDGRRGHPLFVSDPRPFYLGHHARTLYFFLGAAVLVMLLTCVNVVGLVLARALRRGPEFALRGALGGGQAGFVRQLLVEGAVLAAPAGALGLLLTVWAVRALSAWIPAGFLESGGPVPVDRRVAMAAFALTAITSIVFGLAPALSARRIDLNATLGRGGRTIGRSPAQVRSRHLLLGVQMALTLVLLATAALFVRSYVGLTRVPTGFDAWGRVSLTVTLSGPRYEADEQIRAYAATLLERVGAVAGVHDAAVATSTPLYSGPLVFFIVPDRPRPAPGEESRAILRSVTPDYFRTLGIPLAAGRAFMGGDAAGAPRVAIVNEVLAAQLFPGISAIDRTIELLPGARAPWTRHPGPLTIVGVAHNAKEIFINETPMNDIYVPFAQMPAPRFEMLARAAIPPAVVGPALRKAAADLDPALPLSRVSTVGQRIDEALQQDRFNTLMVATFAATGLLLAAIGIFGALAYAVQERRREFGVRLALGAQRRTILFTALGESLRVAGAGAAAGIAALLILSRLIGSALYLVPGSHNGLLYGVTTTDPLALTAAVASLAAVTLVAAMLPARQATRVDPLQVLRSE